MPKNYGLTFCREIIRILTNQENEMINETGVGYDLFSQEYRTLTKYSKYLEQWKYEKENGLEPSYDPEEHGH